MARPAADAVILLVVAHVYREDELGEEIIRIIPAREAEKRDIKRYQAQALDESSNSRTARRIAARQAAGDDSGINYEEFHAYGGTAGTDGTLARHQAEGASERAT